MPGFIEIEARYLSFNQPDEHGGRASRNAAASGQQLSFEPNAMNRLVQTGELPVAVPLEQIRGARWRKDFHQHHRSEDKQIHIALSLLRCGPLYEKNPGDSEPRLSSPTKRKSCAASRSSGFGPKPTCQRSRRLSAIEGRTDPAQTPPEVRA
jgi:hypothetical protein